MKFTDKTILITDPCYIINRDVDWEICNYGNNMEAFGIENYETYPTGIGDGCWNLYGCDDPDTMFDEFQSAADKNTYPYDSDEISNKLYDLRQEYAADSGTTSVFDLAEVESYNPNIREYIQNHPGLVAVVENFTGEITTDYLYFDDYKQLIIKGKGTTNFITL
jgi:hypothetical protein